MKLRALLLTGGVLLAGCSSAATGRTSSHSTPTSARAASTPVAPAVAAQATIPPATTGDAYTRATTDLKDGNYNAAATEFRASIKAHQHVAASYAGLGTAYAHLSRFPVAFQGYSDAARLDPHNARYQYDAAYAALYSQNYHAAVAYATSFIKLRPSDPSGYHLRFLAYGSLLNAKKQVQDARIIARLLPHNADAYDDLGIALSNGSQFKQSVTAFTHAISLNPHNINYYINRGLAENLAKQPRAALADFERARSMTTNAATIKKLDGAIGVLKKEVH